MERGYILHREELQTFKGWFKQYVQGFYSDDPAVQAGIRLKEEHTRRVCTAIVGIGRSLDLPPEDLHLAEAVALFHDLGRFRQYATYHTFNDRRSENHALLGVRELERAGVLAGLPEEERNLITMSIEYHNLRDLPGKLPERPALFARLIRDADKLDILQVFTGSLERKEAAPNPLLNSGLPDTPGYSPVLIRNLLQGELCNYSDMKNFNDRKLLMLSWIYDINFPWTLAEIRRNGHVEKILDSLPGTEEIRRVGERLHIFMASRSA